jgi:DNA polymerase-1
MIEETTTPILCLVDGSNYIYRAFYAIRELSNSKGFPTNAIYGFTNMLMKLLRDLKPQYIAVAFDLKGPTFRHEAFQQYKATRKAIPEALIPQISFIKDIVRGFRIPVLEKQGLEADDIIGTLAHRYAREGFKTVIVSGDKDFMQLISADTIMVDTMKDKTYDSQAVRERFGVGPEKVAEVLGLMGDMSDNIPGVPGVGPKTAERLIQQYGTVEHVIGNVGSIRNANLRRTITEFADQARLSRELATIRTDADMEFDLEMSRYEGKPDTEILKKLFKEFEFSSLLQDLKIEKETIDGAYQMVLNDEDLFLLVENLSHLHEFSFDLVLSSDFPMQAELVGLSFCTEPSKAFYVPIGHCYMDVPDQLKEEDVLKALSPILTNDRIKKNGHDVKSALIVLAGRGINLAALGNDTMVASYVLNPSRHNFELADVARDHLDKQIMTIKDLAGSGAKAIPISEVSVEKTTHYAGQRTDVVLELSSVLAEKIRKQDMADLFYKVEMPLVSVLAAMEKKGVLLDLKLLGEMSAEIEELMGLSEGKIYRLAGERFNINSPKQLQFILFEKFGLPRGKKTKDGYSTDVEVLAMLAQSHELPAEILTYRSMAKLKSTYIDVLPSLVNRQTGRIHTSYNQTVTATGRLSSSNPNLQNIPARTLEGKRIRQAFIAPRGHEIISADYSQIELRVLAHLSGDEALIEAFESGEDIHSRTASDIFGVFPEMVNADMRRQAKVINFGVLYGMSAFGLSKELGIAQKLAQIYIDGYFNKYRKVRLYLDDVLSNARKNGFVTTLLNRRRYLPEINNSNATIRQFAERMAVNAPIQGTAADLIKIGMLHISSQFAKKRLSASMIMQVHDELVFEVPFEEKKEVMELVKKEMEGVITLKVPLKIDIAAGRNWDEAHS